MRYGFLGYQGIETGDTVMVTAYGSWGMAEYRRVPSATIFKVLALFDEGAFDNGDRWWVKDHWGEISWVYTEEIIAIQKASLRQRIRNRLCGELKYSYHDFPESMMAKWVPEWCKKAELALREDWVCAGQTE